MKHHRQLAINFDNKKELSCPCGDVNCTAKVADFAIIALQHMREMMGEPIVVNSSARCVEYNAKIGGKSGSFHVPKNTGHDGSIAFDIYAPKGDIAKNAYRMKLVKFATMLGFNGIGVYDDFIHIDLRPAEAGAIWQG